MRGKKSGTGSVSKKGGPWTVWVTSAKTSVLKNVIKKQQYCHKNPRVYGPRQSFTAREDRWRIHVRNTLFVYRLNRKKGKKKEITEFVYKLIFSANARPKNIKSSQTSVGDLLCVSSFWEFHDSDLLEIRAALALWFLIFSTPLGNTSYSFNLFSPSFYSYHSKIFFDGSSLCDGSFFFLDRKTFDFVLLSVWILFSTCFFFFSGYFRILWSVGFRALALWN